VAQAIHVIEKGSHRWNVATAPLAGSRLVVPYRASISTPMGLGILQATKFEFAPSQLAQH
jgi:hypothetical protein